MQCNMMRLSSCWVNNNIRINNTNGTSIRRRLRASLSVTAGESTMATNSVRVAAAQMTSITDLASNFSTCSRLVKVTNYYIFSSSFISQSLTIFVSLSKEAASAGAKLLCFPEAFSFVGAKDGDSVSIAQPLDGPIMDQYCSLAR